LQVLINPAAVFSDVTAPATAAAICLGLPLQQMQ